MEPTTAIATGCDTGDLPPLDDIERSVGCALAIGIPDTYFPFCFSNFSEPHPYHIPAVRPKAKPKKQHNIKRRNKRK